MQDYEKKEAWRTSQGRMREATPQAQREQQRHLTGYQPSEQERNEKSAPMEVGRLASTFGDVAVGVTGENRLVYTTSQRRSEERVATVQDEKSVRGDGIYRVSGTRNMAYTNPHDTKESAVAFRDAGDKAPSFMRKRFASMSHRKDLETVDKTLPFLDVETDVKEKKALLVEEKTARRSGQSIQTQQLARARSHLAQRITEKKVQERRFQQLLEQGQAQAREGKGTRWDILRRGLEMEEELLADDKPEDDKPEDDQ